MAKDGGRGIRWITRNPVGGLDDRLRQSSCDRQLVARQAAADRQNATGAIGVFAGQVGAQQAGDTLRIAFVVRTPLLAPTANSQVTRTTTEPVSNASVARSDIALGQRPPKDFPHLLAANDNLAASPPAPPQGLYLEAVQYPPELFAEESTS